MEATTLEAGGCIRGERMVERDGEVTSAQSHTRSRTHSHTTVTRAHESWKMLACALSTVCARIVRRFASCSATSTRVSPQRCPHPSTPPYATPGLTEACACIAAQIIRYDVRVVHTGFGR